MKKLLPLLTLMIAFTGMQLQAQIYTDDFESYTTGQGIAQQDGTSTWTTWSNTPGSSEDPLVTSDASNNGSNSIVIQNSNDGVLLLNDLISNRYRVEFYLMVPQNFVGYYNILQDFNGQNSTWGMQLFFQNGTGTIDGNGAAAATFSYTPGTWMKIQHFIDLDNDWIDFYIDDVLIHAYQWSHGTYNNGTGVNKLDAFNFYAWDDQGAETPKFYMDDYIIEQVAIPNPPQNLQTSVTGGDVSLTWTAPVSGTPTSYSVIRDGQEIASVPSTQLTYDDMGLYPQTYSYEVKAYYGQAVGYSASAGPSVETVAGGVAREATLMEIFTGTWCPNCPAIAVAAEDLHATEPNVAIVEYHNGDNYVIPADPIRETYYGVTGWPNTRLDGQEIIAGGGASSLAPDMLQVMEYQHGQKENIPSCATIDLDVVMQDAVTYDLSIDVEETFDYFGGNLSLHIILTESGIYEPWFDQDSLHFVVRSMLPSGNGTNIDFSGGSIQTVNQQLILDPTWDLSRCELVVFLQDNDTETVMQTKKMDMGQFTAIIDESLDKIAVYPNPADDFVNISSDTKINDVKVYNAAGQLMISKAPLATKDVLNVSKLADGIYFVHLITDNSTKVNRLIVE